MPWPSICFLGLDNLPALSSTYAQLGVGGEAIQQTLIAKALARRGFEVSMVVHDLGQPDGIVIEGIRLFKAYRPRAGLPAIRFVHPRWTSVMAALDRAACDVQYTSCAGINVGQIVLAARRLGGRTVFRLASDSDCDPARLIIPYWYGIKIYEWGLPRVTTILAQSEAQRRALRANYGLHSQVAGMLVDRGRADRSFAQRDCAALWIGNIRQLKRPDLMIDLARSSPGLRCQMAGGTQPRSESLYDEVSEAAEKVPNLHFVGPVPYAQTGALFSAARVFVNTSEIEGFPNTYLQAWIHGVPVVAFFDPDGVIAREGLGHAAKSVADMREAVTRLATDEASWRAASERCLAYMNREFSEERVLRPYLDAFGAGDTPLALRPGAA